MSGVMALFYDPVLVYATPTTTRFEHVDGSPWTGDQGRLISFDQVVEINAPSGGV